MIRRVIGLISRRYAFRSSVTGKYVSKAYALLHPSTTQREFVG